jgi:hypothetical protein
MIIIAAVERYFLNKMWLQNGIKADTIARHDQTDDNGNKESQNTKGKDWI